MAPVVFLYLSSHDNIAPITSKGREGPTRIKVRINDMDGWIVLDQIRSIDKTRLCEKTGSLTAEEIIEMKSLIKEMSVD